MGRLPTQGNGAMIRKLRDYSDSEIRAIRKDYSMGHVIDNKRLAEAGANYRLSSDGCRIKIDPDKNKNVRRI